MLQAMKNLLHKYDSWCESMGIKTDEKRCCVPVVRFDPEPEKKQNDSTECDVNKPESAEKTSG